MSSKMSCIILFPLALSLLPVALANIITVPPVDNSVCYGGVSAFYCESDRNYITNIGWKPDANASRGITIDTSITNQGAKSTLHITGLPANDGRVLCNIVTDTFNVSTASAKFTVTEIPPVNNVTIVFKDALMFITWSPPSCIPVNHSYIVSITNDSTTVTNTTTELYYTIPVSPCSSNYTVSITVIDVEFTQYQSIPTIEYGEKNNTQDKPSPVPLVKYTVDTCKGISLTFPYVPSDTHVTCAVYTSDDELVYNNADCGDNSTNIPATVFSNHTGHYTIVTQSVKTVARGDKRNETIVLKKENIRYNVTMIGVEVLSDEFYATFLLEFQECILSQPNYVKISSNTSDSKQYTITGTTFGNTLEIKHKIFPYIKHHSFTIEDSSGKIITRTTNKSSFNIQEFKYEELLESLVIICGFTPGSTTDKCKIRISSNHSDYNTTTHNITRANSDSLIAYDIIPQIPAGTYILQVIEEYDNDVIIVEGSVDIPSPSSCIPDKITSADSILTSKTPSVLHTSPITDKHENYNKSGYIAAVVASVILSVIIIILVVGGIIMFVLVRKWRTSESYPVTKRQRKQTNSGDTQGHSESETAHNSTTGQQMVLVRPSINQPSSEGSCSGEIQNAETSTKVYNMPHSDDKVLIEVVNPDDKTVNVLTMDDTTYSQGGLDEAKKLVDQKVEYVTQHLFTNTNTNTSSIQSESTQLLNKEKP